MLITRRLEFSASYRDRKGATHGHNWELEVTLSGPVDAETGMVIDLKDLKEVMEREVEARFDHRSLNDDTPYFRERAPTPEGFAELIFGLLDAALPKGVLHRIRLSPTDDVTIEVQR
ncbi:MAG: 6-carboxytetrahydropterin synthase [Myxococcota bacterium]